MTKTPREVRNAERGLDCAAAVRAIRSALPKGNGPFPLHEPEFAGTEWEFVKECLDSGWVSYLGPHVERFEGELAKLSGRRHAIVTVSGTAALHVSLTAMGIGSGDEVLAPALTFVATANAITLSGATPHFVDSAHDTLGIDPGALQRHLERVAAPAQRGDGLVNRETGRRIRAIMPVHVLGHPTDDDALAKIANRFGIDVIADATESLGSLYKNRTAAQSGRISVLSFNGNKIVTTGGGGAILTDDDALARRIRHLASTARRPHPWLVEHDEVGFNYRMPALNAALGLAQLERLDEYVTRKRRLAARYAAAVAELEGLRFFEEPSFARSNYWLSAVLLEPEFVGHRDTLLAALHDSGILCRRAWTLMHRLPMYRSLPRAALPVAEDLERRLITLPSGPRLVEQRG